MTGLWSRFRAEDLATPQAFQRDPELVWKWYAWRGEMVSKAAPNPGHLALVEMENHIPDFTLITQNVDGLHTRAGSRTVIELHGRLDRVICSQDGHEVEAWSDTGSLPPRCPRCSAFLRPGVVWFGEMLPSENLEAAMEAARTCQIFWSIGTSSIVHPAASLPYMALDAGAVVVEVNPEETPLTSYASYFLQGPAGEILPELVRQVWGSDQQPDLSG